MSGPIGLLDDRQNLALFDALGHISDDRGVSVTAVALAWLRQQPTVAAPVASARDTDQLKDLVQSFDLVLTADDLACLA